MFALIYRGKVAPSFDVRSGQPSKIRGIDFKGFYVDFDGFRAGGHGLGAAGVRGWIRGVWGGRGFVDPGVRGRRSGVRGFVDAWGVRDSWEVREFVGS